MLGATEQPGHRHGDPLAASPAWSAAALASGATAVAGGTGRVPAAAREERATAGLPDHRDRCCRWCSPRRSASGSGRLPWSACRRSSSRRSSSPSATPRSTNTQLLIVVAALVMMVALDQFINRTRFGRGIRAVAQNPDTAALMGVNKDRVIMLIFLLGGLHGRRRRAAVERSGTATPGSTSASCSASRRSPRRCSAASATCAARCSVVCCSVWSRSTPRRCSRSNWEDVAGFVVLVVRADVPADRPAGRVAGEGTRMTEHMRPARTAAPRRGRRAAASDVAGAAQVAAGDRLRWPSWSFLYYLPLLGIPGLTWLRDRLDRRAATTGRACCSPAPSTC